MQPIEIHPAVAPLVLSGKCREILTEAPAQAGARILAVGINFRREIIPIKVERVRFIDHIVTLNGRALSTPESDIFAKSQGFVDSYALTRFAKAYWRNDELFLVHF